MTMGQTTGQVIILYWAVEQVTDIDVLPQLSAAVELRCQRQCPSVESERLGDCNWASNI